MPPRLGSGQQGPRRKGPAEKRVGAVFALFLRDQGWKLSQSFSHQEEPLRPWVDRRGRAECGLLWAQLVTPASGPAPRGAGFAPARPGTNLGVQDKGRR